MPQLSDFTFNPLYASSIGAALLVLGIIVIVIRRRRPQALDMDAYRKE